MKHLFIKNTRICVAQLGARRHYVVPRALHDAGLLEKFYTDSYIGNKPWLVPIVQAFVALTSSSGARRFLGRKAVDLPSKKIKSLDLLGMRYYLKLNENKSEGFLSNTYSDFGSHFGEAVVDAGFGKANIVYGFNGASVEIFEAAKRNGLRCILDQTIVPLSIYHKLMKAEFEKWPGWQSNFLHDEIDDDLVVRDKREWELADLILCGSEFLAESIGLVGGPKEKCCVVPYGFTPPRKTSNHFSIKQSREDGIKLLFVGEVGLRKGAPYLLEALGRFEPGWVQAKFVGLLRLDNQKIKPYERFAEFLGSVPRDDMYKLYLWADVLVLPSLCEGSSMATYEAKQFGLPVICTPNAGADITDGVDGFIVTPGSVDEIVDAVQRLPELSNQNDQNQAQEQHLANSFDIYRRKLIAAIESI